jgi:hypothetical protein
MKRQNFNCNKNQVLEDGAAFPAASKPSKGPQGHSKNQVSSDGLRSKKI